MTNSSALIQGLREVTNFKNTENGAVAHASTLDGVLDLFGLGGSYRNRSDEEVVSLFRDAYEEDPALAVTCLFYLRDAREGQGERRFFRVAFRWLASEATNVAKDLIPYIAEYGRYDDILYATIDTPLEQYAFTYFGDILKFDLHNLMNFSKKNPTLAAKWAPSINASSYETKRVAKTLMKYLSWDSACYRRTLSALRKKINLVETKMSNGEWSDIDYAHIPSKAGNKYAAAFSRHDSERYRDFITDKDTKVNASVLYPYELVKQAISYDRKIDKDVINKYWANLKDYFNGASSNMLCVVDTSGSMHGNPITIAIGLGMYCAERLNGFFHNYFITFSSRPRLVKLNSKASFVDNARYIYDFSINDNTDLDAVFDLLLDTALSKHLSQEDMPETICVISDMEIDYNSNWGEEEVETNMEGIRKKWAEKGYKLPKLVYWNVDARNNTFLDLGENVSFVSGASPSIFESILTGKTGRDLMLEKLLSERYINIYNATKQAIN